MSSYLLDTSIIIEYLRGKPETIKLLEEVDGALTSSTICLAELFEGVYHHSQPKKPEKTILTLFQRLNKVFDFNQETAKETGRIRAHLRKKGQKIDDLDVLIASTCTVHNQVLITRNTKHFQKIPGLRLYGK